MGLYDDDNAAATAGDVNSAEYFWAKACNAAFEEALKAKQPEDKVGQLIGKLLDALQKASRTFPNHAGLAAWKEKAEKIKGKINPLAKPVPFDGSFPFGLNEFTQGWAALEHMRFARAQGDWKTVLEQSRSVTSRWYHCAEKSKKYPESWKKHFDDGLAESKVLFKEANLKR